MSKAPSKRYTLKYMPKGVSSVALLQGNTRVDIHNELNAVRAETARIAGFFSTCKPDDVAELVQTAVKVQNKLDKAFQITSNPAHNEILCKHTVIGEVLEKLKAIAFQYVALLSVHRASLQKFLNTRSRRKVEQFSSALLVEASVLAELSDDLLSQSDANYQSQGGEDEEVVEILDADGKRMWLELFGPTTFMVDVMKVVRGLMKELNVNLTGTERKILLQVFDPSNTGQISSLRWNEFLKGFGPMQNCLYNLQEMLAQPWFHGFLSKSDSTKLLEVEPQGTFMVRFSSTKPGSFSLAHTMAGSVVNHVIIHTRENGFAVAEASREKLFQSVSHLIEAYAQLLVRPYSQTFPRQLWWHGDISGEEASELLKEKKPGTFIIRFSGTQRGCFASSFVGQNHVIEKGLIVGSPGGYTLSGKQFASMEEIVASLIQWNIFTEPYKNTTNEVNDAMRFKIVSEIVATEQSYVRALTTLNTLFVKEFQNNPKISPADVTAVFANVDQLLTIHRPFCAQLERVVQNWDAETAALGHLFLQFNPQLVPVYSVYANNYNLSMQTLERLKKKSEFQAFLQSLIQRQPKGPRGRDYQNDLSGLTIQIIQRIPRYILLITDLIKHTAGPHNDYDALCDALEAIKCSADQINENKKRAEDIEEVRERCQTIVGVDDDLAVAGRYIVKEGKLTPVEYKGSDYWVIFFNDRVLLTKKKGRNFKHVDTMILHNVQIIPVPDSAVSHNQFRVCTTRREITLEAETPLDKNAWIAALKKEFNKTK